MTTNVIRLDKPMTKPQLIRHLLADHAQAVGLAGDLKRITRKDLADIHAFVHLGLGR